MYIIKKVSKNNLTHFVLYEDKLILVESDIFFDNSFINRFDDIMDLAINKSELEITDIYSKYKINKNDLIGIITINLMKLNLDFYNKISNYFQKYFQNGHIILSILIEKKEHPIYKGNQNMYADTVYNKDYFRVLGVLFYTLQFTNKEGLYNGSSKLFSLKDNYKLCQSDIYIDGLYFKNIEKIDQIDSLSRSELLKIKGFQNKDSMNLYINQVFDENFIKFIKRKGFDAIGIIPNNIQRKISLNQEINKYLKNKFSELDFINIYINDFPDRMPQKSTKGLCNRISNADKLLEIQDIKNHYTNVLIVDDVFGSGATMNSVAKKIKNQKTGTKVTGFSILSSYHKGFDVLSEI